MSLLFWSGAAGLFGGVGGRGGGCLSRASSGPRAPEVSALVGPMEGEGTRIEER